MVTTIPNPEDGLVDAGTAGSLVVSSGVAGSNHNLFIHYQSL